MDMWQTLIVNYWHGQIKLCQVEECVQMVLNLAKCQSIEEAKITHGGLLGWPFTLCIIYQID